MNVTTWIPGTDKYLDKLFDDLREKRYQDHDNRLWQNYSRKFYDFTIAHTIFFDDNGVPELCASIGSRECWPKNVYRIVNRTWKCNNKKKYLKKISVCMGESVKSQIDWLEKNTDCELYFISRQTNNWDNWVIDSFQKDFQVSFTKTNYKYLTCPCETDSTCWQKIIYNGNPKLLEHWKKK